MNFFLLAKQHLQDDKVVAIIQAPITSEKSWVAFLPGRDPKWVFKRKQIQPVEFKGRLVFPIKKAGIYEHRKTSSGSGFVFIDKEGCSHIITKDEAIELLS